MDQVNDALAEMQRKIYELQIKNLEDDTKDHERRIRLLEETATKFNFLLFLTFGNGILSIIALLKLFI